MNKVLFGIFLGVLFNIPTFGMGNNLGQFGGNFQVAKDGKGVYDCGYQKSGVNGQFDVCMADEQGGPDFSNNTQQQYNSIDSILYDQNYVIQYYNYIYGNMEEQPVFSETTFVKLNIQDIINNIDRNYLSNDIRDYIDTQLNQTNDTNNILPTRRKLNAEEFKNEHGYYFYGQAEQLAYADIEHLSKDFAELDECVKTELINDKDIKCGCCGGGLVLEGLDDCGRQIVRCKNKKGCCSRSGRRELLEINLYDLPSVNEGKWKKKKKNVIIKLFLEGKSVWEIADLLRRQVMKDGSKDSFDQEKILDRLKRLHNSFLPTSKGKIGEIKQYTGKSEEKIQLDLAFLEILKCANYTRNIYGGERECIQKFMESKTVDETELGAALNDVKTYYEKRKNVNKPLEIFKKYVEDQARRNSIQNYFNNNYVDNNAICNGNNIQEDQNCNMNINLSTSEKLTIGKFRAKYGDYLYEDYLAGQIEQLPKEFIKQFCEDFNKLDDKAKKEVIKHIKCGYCGSRLVLAGKNSHGKQKVKCKNEKGKCLKVKNRREFLLEMNLYIPYVDSFKDRYEYYLKGNEQLKEEDVVGFCEEFSEFGVCVKRELAKYIKCGCCGGGLALEGLDDYGRQKVMCTKNDKCERYGKLELLELNLLSPYLKKQRL